MNAVSSPRSRAETRPGASARLPTTSAISAGTSPADIAAWSARKLEPRPESRMPTRAVMRSDVRDAGTAGLDPADRDRLAAAAPEGRDRLLARRRIDHHHHADSHV